ncbi:hypothetical protein ACOSP7_027223 [Xanthoceras sorbifolium]
MVSLSFLKRSSRFNWKIQAMTWVIAGYYVHGLPPSCGSLSCLRRLGFACFWGLGCVWELGLALLPPVDDDPVTLFRISTLTMIQWTRELGFKTMARPPRVSYASRAS